jgi:hypothetical protein
MTTGRINQVTVLSAIPRAHWTETRRKAVNCAQTSRTGSHNGRPTPWGEAETGRVECRLRGPTCVTPPKGGDSLVFYVASHYNETIVQSNRLWSGTLPQPTFRRLVLGVSNPSHNLGSTSREAGGRRGGRTHE